VVLYWRPFHLLLVKLSCSSKGEEIIEAVTSEKGLIGGVRLIGGTPLIEIPGVIVLFMIEDQLLKKGVKNAFLFEILHLTFLFN
jgi:hypothetical protein